MNIKATQLNSARHPSYLPPRYVESAQTKAIRQLGNDIKKIERENDYIAANGKAPPATPNFYKKMLNTY